MTTRFPRWYRQEMVVVELSSGYLPKTTIDMQAIVHFDIDRYINAITIINLKATAGNDILDDHNLRILNESSGLKLTYCELEDCLQISLRPGPSISGVETTGKLVLDAQERLVAVKVYADATRYCPGSGIV